MKLHPFPASSAPSRARRQDVLPLIVLPHKSESSAPRVTREQLAREYVAQHGSEHTVALGLALP